MEALPVSDREAARSDGSIGVISGVIVSLLAVVVIITVLGVKLYRRRKSHQAIISYLQSVGHMEQLNLSLGALEQKVASRLSYLSQKGFLNTVDIHSSDYC